MIFYCAYKLREGRVVEETVDALSPSDVKRKILLKHPLAEFISEPTIEKHAAGSDNSKQIVGAKVGRRILLIVMSCLLFLAGLLLLYMFMFHGSSDMREDKDKTIITNDTTKTYADAYRNLVSIKSGDAIGTGFKLKMGKDVYLYTCLHCILGDKPIVARDSVDDILELGDLELSEGRDLVRFRLPHESVGFVIAGGEDIKIGTPIVAYGDTLGGGVMTQNAGRILAIGRRKIEIDAAVLQGNSGGPVLDSLGRVVGVISSGSIDNTIWSKDTRYENVRKFAERVDGSEWRCVDYAELCATFAYLFDTFVAIGELREFFQKTAGRKFTEKLYRPFVKDEMYKGSFGHADEIKNIYSTWNKMSEEDVVTQRIAADMIAKVKRGEPFSMVQYNQLNESTKRFNSFLRQALVTNPSVILTTLLSEVKSIELECFEKSKKALIEDIETVLLPAIRNYENFVSDREQEAREQYKKTYDIYQKSL